MALSLFMLCDSLLFFIDGMFIQVIESCLAMRLHLSNIGFPFCLLRLWIRDTENGVIISNEYVPFINDFNIIKHGTCIGFCTAGENKQST